jgi:hypothetical protein
MGNHDLSYETYHTFGDDGEDGINASNSENAHCCVKLHNVFSKEMDYGN